jgi:hypothetical protein
MHGPVNIKINCFILREVGQAVERLVEALCYKPEGLGVRFPMVSLEIFH